MFIVLLLSCTLLQAQNVNGFWKGSLTMPGGCFSENNIELQVKLDGENGVGDSYHYLNIDNYVKKNFVCSYDAASRRIVVQEELITTYKIRTGCSICIKRYELYYRREGNKEMLIGSWTGKVAGTNNSCDNGNIILTRIKESAFKEIPEIIVDTGKIKLDFYDNNEVDGDSITVLVNQKTIITHQRLTTKPITAYVTVDLKNTFQEVEMVAENLGSIPPNTAMLIITAGEKRYQLFLSSTETKSAKVRFVLEASKQHITADAAPN
jgi:hypothetical protein